MTVAVAVTLAAQTDASVLPTPADVVAASDRSAVAGMAHPLVRQDFNSDDDDDSDDDDNNNDNNSNNNNNNNDNEDDGGGGFSFFEGFQAPRRSTCTQYTKCGKTTNTKYVKKSFPHSCFKKGDDEEDDCVKTAASYVEDGELKKWYKCTCFVGGRVTATIDKQCSKPVPCTFNTEEGDSDDDDGNDADDNEEE